MLARNGWMRGVGVGAGYFSGFHYDAWKRIANVEISAIADLDLAKAERVAERFDIPRVYSDVRVMLEEERPDFVDIITPPPSHRGLCELAAEHGADVICQKPLAPTLTEAEEIVRAMEAKSVRFLVHENWRWQPWYREIRSILDGGTLGDPSSACFTMRLGDGWREDAYLSRQPYFREYPRLLMYETGVHFIDVFRYLFGEVTSVYARLRRLNPAIAGEDSGHVVLGFASGVMAVLDANRYNEPETSDDPRYTFGTLRLDAAGGHLRLHSDGRLVVKRLGAPAHEHPYEPSRMGFAGDSILGLQRHFVERLRSGEAFESEGRDYLRSLRVVEACYVSAAEARVVHLGRDGEEVRVVREMPAAAADVLADS